MSLEIWVQILTLVLRPFVSYLTCIGSVSSHGKQPIRSLLVLKLGSKSLGVQYGEEGTHHYLRWIGRTLRNWIALYDEIVSRYIQSPTCELRKSQLQSGWRLYDQASLDWKTPEISAGCRLSVCCFQCHLVAPELTAFWLRPLLASGPPFSMAPISWSPLIFPAHRDAFRFLVPGPKMTFILPDPDVFYAWEMILLFQP